VRPATVAGARRRSIAEWLADTMQPGLWAATAAAMLFAAVLSFELGREASVNLAATETLSVASADDDGWDVVPSVGDLL